MDLGITLIVAIIGFGLLCFMAGGFVVVAMIIWATKRAERELDAESDEVGV